MQKRQLGNTDLAVYPITFGGNVFGWTLNERESFEILDGFIAAGFNFIDTADVYSTWVPRNVGGESEKIIGKWMKERNNREAIILTTKVGADMGNGKKGLSKKYILKAVEDSLRRLQTDYLDLYQSHYDDLTTPISETLEAYNQLIREGKIRFIGASNMSAARLQESLDISAELGLPRYETFQPHYNLYERKVFEAEDEALCLDQNLGILNYYSLAGGFLSGKYRSAADLSKSARGGGVEKYLDSRGFKILEALDQLSDQYNSSPAAVSLAWLIQRPSVTAPIVSATSLNQLQSIIQAPELNLDDNAIGLLNIASAW